MKRSARKKRYRIRSKFRFITSIIIMSALMIGIAGAATHLYDSHADTVQQYREITIDCGDTLWQIACENTSSDTDVRKAVHDICRINDIEPSEIVPGMVIMIPKDM